MNFEQLSTLIKSGLTEDQLKTVISLYESPQNPPASVPVSPDPATTPTPAPDPAPAPLVSAADSRQAASGDVTGAADKAVAAAGAVPAEESETVKLLREMMGLMQKQNIMTAGMPSTAPADASEVLASILNPQPKKQ